MPPPATGTAPPGTLIWGHREALATRPLEFLESCVREHGDLVRLRVGPVRPWFVSDPAIIGEILTTRGASFRKDISYRRTKVMLGDGLLTSDGAEHDRRSRIAQPAFRAAEVERYAASMVSIAAEIVARWPDGARIDLQTELSRIALAIVARALFGTDLLADAEALGSALTELLALLEHRFYKLVPLPLAIPTPHNRRFRRARAVLDDAVYAMIRRCRAGATSTGTSPHPTDLLSRLVEAREGGTGLDDEQLRDEVMTLLLAGHETTANALTFTFRLLAEHPEARERLRAEVDAAVAAGGGRVSPASVPRLPYTAQVFSEALRLYPPGWILSREALEPVDLGGGRLRLARGATVGLSPYIVQRDPRWWPEPLAFRPERFAPDAPRHVPHSYIPFGGGKRACIGRSFALLEAAMLIPTIVSAVDFEIDVSAPLGLLPQMTLRAAGGVPAIVRRRGRPGGDGGSVVGRIF